MIAREVLLAGAGAAHLAALRRFARRPLPSDVRLTFVVPAAEEPYSGMVPGVVAGRFPRSAATMNLAALAHTAGARLVLARADGLDRDACLLRAGTRPPLRYDLLSLSVGASARLAPGAAEHAIPLRPLGAFLDAWEALLAAGPPPGMRLLVAGGGAAGVEVALAARRRLGTASRVVLLSPDGPLPGHAPAARRAARAALAEAGVAEERGEAERVEAGAVLLADGRRLSFDAALWAAGPAAPGWLAGTGLPLDRDGYLAVDAALRSTGDARVFAAGDCATVLPHPRPRAGVYAVRQGRPLAENLRRVLAGKEPRPVQLQRSHLALLLDGDRAIAVKGSFAARGAWALRLKDRIDRAWVAGVSGTGTTPLPRPAMDPGMDGEVRNGTKLPAEALVRALARLPRAPDDPALLAPPAPGRVLVQTVGHLRTFCDDPYLSGRIAATHALGEVAAMGAAPLAALAIAALPPAADAVLEGDLFAVLRGGQEVLEAEGARLAGGHGGGEADAALGFAVTSEVDPARALRRSGLRPGDALLLTKPLGTDAVLAAAMQGRAPGRALEAALASMQASPFPAARVLLAHGATACAGVAELGLIGHLLEMLRASGCGAALDPLAAPALDGALEALADGIKCTPHSVGAAAAYLGGASDVAPARLALLLDPQTAGGLLAGVPGERAEACLAALRAAGCPAAILGRAEAGPPRVRLQPRDAWDVSVTRGTQGDAT